MNLFEIKSVQDLKKIGPLYEVRRQLINLLGPNIKFKSRTWEDLFNSIQSLRKISKYIPSENSNISDSSDLFFKGKSERLIYTLLELDGKCRMDKLGVNKMHFSKKNIANEWRNEIAKIIHPDICNHPLASDAMVNLTEMYKEMIK